MLRVTVIFEYADINDAEGDLADQIMDSIGQDCEAMALNHGASMVWIDDCYAKENEEK